MILFSALKSMLAPARVKSLLMVPLFVALFISVTITLQHTLKPAGWNGSVGLLQMGQWLKNTSIPEIWQPQDCTLHIYKEEDIKKCMPPNSTMIFFGDSTSRQVFWSVANLLDSGLRETGNLQTNTWFERHNITIHLFWDPYFNDTRSRGILAQMAAGGYIGEPTFIYATNGLWHAQYDSRQRVLEGYKRAVDEFVDLVQGAVPGTLGTVYYAPTMLPNYEKMDVLRNRNLTPYYLNRLHAYTNHKFNYNPNLPFGAPGNDAVLHNNYTGAPAAYYVPVFNRIGLGHDVYDAIGIHYRLTGTDLQAQILLNHYCNPRIFQSKFPHETTCNVPYNSPNALHHLLAGLMCAICAALVLASHASNHPALQAISIQAALMTALVTIITTLYAFVCDRTHYFNKQIHMLSWFELFAMGQVTLVAAAVTLTRGRTVVKTETRLLTHPVLNMEWKGLAVAVWLACKVSGYAHDHYSGEALCRILETTLLFAETYKFALATMAGEIDRFTVVAQLLRTNVLPVMLTLTLNTSYYFYVLPLKITFWIVFVYVGYGILSKKATMDWLSRILSQDLINMLPNISLLDDFLRLALMTLVSLCAIIPIWSSIQNSAETRFGFDLYLEFCFGVAAVVLAVIVNNPDLSAALCEWRDRPKVRVALIMCAGVFGLFLCNLTLMSGAFQAAEHYPFSFHIFASLGFIYMYMIVRTCLLFTAKDTFLYVGAFEFMGSCWLEMVVVSLHTLQAGDGTVRLYIMTTSNSVDTGYTITMRRIANFAILITVFLVLCWRMSLAWQGVFSSAASLSVATRGISNSNSDSNNNEIKSSSISKLAMSSVSPFTRELFDLADEEEQGIIEPLDSPSVEGSSSRSSSSSRISSSSRSSTGSTGLHDGLTFDLSTTGLALETAQDPCDIRVIREKSG